MIKTLHVTDSQLIFNLLFNHFFIGSYNILYKRPYMPELAVQKLAELGIPANSDEISVIEKLLNEYGISQKDIIPDLILFLNTFKFKYDNYTKKNIPASNTNELKRIDEIISLKNLIEELKNKSEINSIEVEFKLCKKAILERYKFKDETFIEHFINSLQELFNQDLIQMDFKFCELENGKGKEVYRNFLKLLGKENTPAKDNIKIMVMKASSFLLGSYFFTKELFGMKNNVKICTNQAAEFIGRLLSLINLIESEDEYDNNSHHLSYKRYLTQKVKSYLSTGRKSR